MRASSSLDGARTLGSYQLLSQLAVGGMAEIYVARTHGVGGFEKLVALKVIHPNFSSDPNIAAAAANLGDIPTESDGGHDKI